MIFCRLHTSFYVTQASLSLSHQSKHLFSLLSSSSSSNRSFSLASAKGTRKFDPHNFQSSSSHDNGTKKNQICSVTKLHINASDGLGFYQKRKRYTLGIFLYNSKILQWIHSKCRIFDEISLKPFQPMYCVCTFTNLHHYLSSYRLKR